MLLPGKKACGDENCDPKAPYIYPGVSNIPIYQDTDKDGLNDREESLLGSKWKSPEDYDSNGDMIPDGLAFFNGLAFLEGTGDSTLQDTDRDGITNAEEVKLHTPPRIPNTELNGVTPYKYNLVPLSL